MPSPALNEEQAKRQSKALAKFHEDGRNGKAPTSAGSIKPPKSLANLKAKLSELVPDCNNVIRQAVIGGLVSYMEVWKGKPDELQSLLDSDPSASLEEFELPNGKVIPVIISWAPPDARRIATAEWTLKQEIELKKSMVDAKNKSLDLAIKKKKAEDEGAIPKENPQEAAKEAAAKGEHIKPVNFSLEIDED